MKNYIKKLIDKCGKKRFFVYIAILIGFYVIYSLQPYFLANIVKSNGKDFDIRFIFLTVLSFLCVAFIRFPNNYFLQLTRKYSKEVLWEDAEKKKYGYFVNKDVGEIQNLIGEISYAARSLQYESMQILIKTLIMVITYTFILAKYNIKVAIIYIVSYLFYFVFSVFLSKNNSKGIQGVLNSSSSINSYIIDVYRNIESILSSNSFKYERKKYNDLLDNERKSYFNLQNSIDMCFLLQQVVLMIITCIVFGVSVISKNNNYIYVDVLLVLIYSAFNLSDTGKEFLCLMETKDRLCIALDNLEFEKNNNQGVLLIKDNKRAVTINDLSVSYDEKLIFSGINLEINKRDKVAIVGNNGCGKTTLLKTIAGLLEPNKGIIKYGINDFNDMGYYSQDTVLFDRTVLENIIYPNCKYDVEKVMNIVKKVDLNSLIKTKDDLVTRKPGDFGTKFSGGEKQKILLARAIINNKEIILFDEITSALDKKSEEMFENLLQNDLKNKTVVCITHKEVKDKVFNKVIKMPNKINK